MLWTREVVEEKSVCPGEKERAVTIGVTLGSEGYVPGTGYTAARKGALVVWFGSRGSGTC